MNISRNSKISFLAFITSLSSLSAYPGTYDPNCPNGQCQLERGQYRLYSEDETNFPNEQYYEQRGNQGNFQQRSPGMREVQGSEFNQQSLPSRIDSSSAMLDSGSGSVETGTMGSGTYRSGSTIDANRPDLNANPSGSQYFEQRGAQGNFQQRNQGINSSIPSSNPNNPSRMNDTQRFNNMNNSQRMNDPQRNSNLMNESPYSSNTSMNDQMTDKSANMTDSSLDPAVKVRLALQGDTTLSLDARNVQVSYEGGQIILSGKVDTDLEKIKVENLARKTSDKSVVSKLNVIKK